jgi:predicted small lipoprotein YifL
MKTTALSLLALALAIALAGCGSGGGNNAKPASDAPDASGSYR